MSDALYALTEADAARIRKLLADYEAGRLTMARPDADADRAPVESYYGKSSNVIAAGGTGQAEVFDTGGTDKGFTVAAYNATASAFGSGVPLSLARDPFTGVFVAAPFVSLPTSKFVSNVCNGSGNSLVVQYTDLNGTVTCITNPCGFCGCPCGSGSGSGSGGGGCLMWSALNCCPNQCWPTTLHVTITGPCTALNGSYTLTQSSSFAGWFFDFTYNGRPVEFQVGCYSSNNIDGGMGLTLVYTDDSTGIFQSIVTNENCSTFSFSGSVALGSDPTQYGPCHGETINWTVTT